MLHHYDLGGNLIEGGLERERIGWSGEGWDFLESHDHMVRDADRPHLDALLASGGLLQLVWLFHHHGQELGDLLDITEQCKWGDMTEFEDVYESTDPDDDDLLPAYPNDGR